MAVGLSPQEELAQIIADAEKHESEEVESEKVEPVGDQGEPEQEEESEQDDDKSSEDEPNAEKAEKEESEDAEVSEEGQPSDKVATDESKPNGESLFPRGAQRRIDKQTKRIAQLEAEIQQMRNLNQPGDDKSQETPAQQEFTPNEQMAFQMRQQTASQRFQQKAQSSLSAEEIQQISSVSDIEVGPLTSLALMEHDMGPQIALEISKNEFVKDLLSNQNDISAVEVINTLGNELRYRGQQVKQAPIEMAKPVVKNKAPKPTPKANPTGKGSVSPENMSDEEFNKWYLETTGRA